MFRYIRSSEGAEYSYQYKGNTIYVGKDGTHYIYTKPHGQGKVEFADEKEAREYLESCTKANKKVYSADEVEGEDLDEDHVVEKSSAQEEMMERTKNLVKQFITFVFLQDKDKIDVTPEECAIRSYNQLADFIRSGKLQEDEDYIQFLKDHKNYLKAEFEKMANTSFEYEEDAIPRYDDNW